MNAIKVYDTENEKQYWVMQSNIAGWTKLPANERQADAMVYTIYPVNGRTTFVYFGDVSDDIL